MDTLRTDLFEDEVYVFTPKGEVKSLAAGATPLDFAYEVHTEIGHRCVGARVNGKIVPLHCELRLRGHRRDPHRQARARPLARLAGDGQDHARAQQDQGVVQGGVPSGHRAHRARSAAGAPAQAGPARAEDHRLGAAGGRDPRDGLPQGGRLLHRAGRREGLAEGGRQQGDAAPEAGRGRRRRGHRGRAAAGRPSAPAPDEVLGPVRDQGRGRRGCDAAPGQVLPAGAGR